MVPVSHETSQGPIFHGSGTLPGVCPGRGACVPANGRRGVIIGTGSTAASRILRELRRYSALGPPDPDIRQLPNLGYADWHV
jgi:hypothetical protein